MVYIILNHDESVKFYFENVICVDLAAIDSLTAAIKDMY